MPLSDLASIGTILSGLAVVASLIYLSIQIRQPGMQPDFRGYVDSLIGETPVTTSTDRMKIWRELCGDERAPANRS
jgi:hypothetical protein